MKATQFVIFSNHDSVMIGDLIFVDGYYRGYTEFESRRTRGWDRAQAAAFEEKYCI